MSAIVGLLDFRNETDITTDGEAMMQALTRYKADAVRTWHDGNVFMGCLAQWVTPESVNERLPCEDAASGLAITADAIIDNRDELCDRLDIGHGRRVELSDSVLWRARI